MKLDITWIVSILALVGVGVLIQAGLLDASIKDTIIGVIIGGAGGAAIRTGRRAASGGGPVEAEE